MEELRQWLLSVSVCAVLLSFARRLVPEGAMSEAVKFTAGILLLLVLLRPLTGGEIALPEAEFSDYGAALTQTQRELSRERDMAVKQSIERKTEEYIGAKGLRAKVECEWEDDAWLPRRAVLYGERTQALSDFLSVELGITQQEWREDG